MRNIQWRNHGFHEGIHSESGNGLCGRVKQLDDELPATECHKFRGINGCFQRVTKGVALPFSVRCEKVLQRRQRQDRVRDLIKASEVIDEIKQHEDFTLTHRAFDLWPHRSVRCEPGRSGQQNGEGLFTGRNRDFHGREISSVSGCQRKVQRA